MMESTAEQNRRLISNTSAAPPRQLNSMPLRAARRSGDLSSATTPNQGAGPSSPSE